MSYDNEQFIPSRHSAAETTCTRCGVLRPVGEACECGQHPEEGFDADRAADASAPSEVRLSNAEREALWQCVSIAPSNHDRRQIEAAVSLALARRLARAKTEALREAADECETACTTQRGPCFCGGADWLRDRADDLEAGG